MATSLYCLPQRTDISILIITPCHPLLFVFFSHPHLLLLRCCFFRPFIYSLDYSISSLSSLFSSPFLSILPSFVNISFFYFPFSLHFFLFYHLPFFKFIFFFPLLSLCFNFTLIFFSPIFSSPSLLLLVFFPLHFLSHFFFSLFKTTSSFSCSFFPASLIRKIIDQGQMSGNWI